VKPFARLLERLTFTPQRNGKLRLLAHYFATTPDPDRGIGLAALTGGLSLRHAKPALLRELVTERVDPELFAMSYDFVGDLAETISLIWPGPMAEAQDLRLGEVRRTLDGAGRTEVPRILSDWLDTLDSGERFALLKLVTGGLRVGVSARLAKRALADFGGVEVERIEELWHGLDPPYETLFAWLDGRAGPPEIDERSVFRPLMLAHALDEQELATFAAEDFAAEWKWDGIRVQLVAGDGVAHLYSRTGDDIGGSFPDIVEHVTFDAVLDGELLVAHDGEVASFNDLQQRLGRKTVSRKMLAEHPAHIRLYDILFDQGEDLRALPFVERRQRLEAWHEGVRPERMDLSPLVPFDDWEKLADLRAGTREAGIEGLMLKRRDSAYLSGRPKGPWFKWKRAALLADCVLMYAQRGHGKRSSFYSDYTFGCWRDGAEGAELVPVGKAYFGFTDAELTEIDRWVRNNTVDRFGPVRAVSPGLVFEVAFDSVHRSKRHKSGLAMRFPRIHRLRWDKPVDEADRVESLEQLAE